MSFQGDVAGIGLGELLQGLARGGREGVLTLRGGGLGATLGLAGGQIFLLPEPDEEPESWRKRCERAWVKDPNHRIDALRMSEIAFASRMETMFQLLDCEGVHFRFEPGPLPTPSDPEEDELERPLGRAETGTRLEVKVPVHCQGISVEFLLLEYARLSDECRTHGDSNLLPIHAVPRLIVPDVPAPELDRFWSECDGMSNVVEIADRLGWPVRQCKATLVDLSVKGYLRFCDARELLVLAQREIGQNFFARAASRLSGWCLASPPGPPPVGDVELLLQEWERGKLPVVLASMSARSARTLMRRIDLVVRDVRSAIRRWRELYKYHRHDTLIELCLVQWQLRSEDEADQPQVADLLKLARKFQDRAWRLRAGVVLRAAAQRLPESTSVRLEVGTRMLAVGLVEEGAHWVLEACRTMIDGGLSEKSLGPLRNVVEADPTNREARSLLSLARTKCAEGKKTRRNSVVALASVLLVSTVALVKVRVDQDYDRRLSEVTEMMDRPRAALELLNTNFEDDDSQRIATLRHNLRARIESDLVAVRTKWTDRYKAAQMECTLGDELMGLKLALELPEPPRVEGLADEDWPTIGELLDGLAARLEQTFAQFPPIDPEGNRSESSDLLNNEKRFEGLVTRLADMAGEPERTFTLDAFIKRLNLLSDAIAERNDRRADAREKRENAEREQLQDQLLAAARIHRQAGDVQRAVENYRKLFDLDKTGKIRLVLEREKEQAERHLAAFLEARELAEAGDHTAAEEALAAACPNPSEHLLPWLVESQPSGARARLGNGSIRVTPFTMESAIDERIEITFEHPGHVTERTLVERPGRVLAVLSRLPSLAWNTGSRVNALPVSVEDDLVLADRAGRIARLDASGETRWERELDSLSGVARTPVFLPRRQGTLLVLTEEGSAWLVEVDSGRVEGPWRMESPPVAGPTAVPEGVVVAFADGRTALWSSRLQPRLLEEGSELAESGSGAPRGTTSTLSVLRRSADAGTRLDPPWGEWSVDVGAEFIHVTHDGDPQRAFAVRHSQEWSYIAWGAPTAKHPDGRLWVSDEEGLRAFEP